MKMIFNVIDRGDTYEVISINNNELPFSGIKDGTLEVFSWEVFETVARKLNEGKKVYIPKLFNKQVTIDDIVVEDDTTSSLESLKNIYIIKIRDIAHNRLSLNKLDLFTFLEYIDLSNYFASLGFYITPENREEKYLEIINYASNLTVPDDPNTPDVDETDTSASDVIIEKLEKYLSALDMIENLKIMYYSINDYISRINNALTEEEVESIYSEFRTTFS